FDARLAGGAKTRDRFCNGGLDLPPNFRVVERQEGDQHSVSRRGSLIVANRGPASDSPLQRRRLSLAQDRHLIRSSGDVRGGRGVRTGGRAERGESRAQL